ncbi:MAG: bifunctional oligoribonuclease/PAP phosphatase NrnA [Bacteroidota bacterium]|nr:bifunctional oligoribonuclease/PAP phosphatase NrnA [Bacteroidota bacterium]
MININDQTIEQVKSLINKAEKISIIGHHNPDGDAISGSLGIAGILKQLGKQPHVIMPSKIPNFLKFIPGTDNIIIHNEDKKAQQLLAEAELIFCIDFNSASRVKALEKDLETAPAKKILLDHHPDPKNFADFSISETTSSSASEIVFDFIKMAGYTKHLTKDIATALYTGIMTDTLHFSIETAGKQTFKAISELLDFNIDKDYIYNKVYNTYSWNRLKLVGYLQNKKMKRIKNHPVAYTILTETEKEQFNYQRDDHEGVVNIPLSAENIEVSVLFIESEDEIRVSMRSKGAFNVNKFARRFFNGGGHDRAAGGRLQIEIEEIPTYFKKALDSFSKSSTQQI